MSNEEPLTRKGHICLSRRLARVSKIGAMAALSLWLPQQAISQTSGYTNPIPQYTDVSGLINVDGNLGDWSPGVFEPFAPLTTGGRELGESGVAHVGDLYLRYDCSTNIMYVLVYDYDPDDDSVFERNPDDAWLRINDNSTKEFDGHTGDDGTAPDFQWVGTDEQLLGYEASFPLDPGNYTLEAHVQYNQTETGSTGKSDQIALSVTCEDQPPLPDPSIDIEKSTNGNDADAAPGADIEVDTDVIWEYEVENTGNVDLTDVEVTDDIIGKITCPQTFLAAGDSMTCTHDGIATLGPYANVGTVEGYYGEEQVTDSDPSHYTGVEGAAPAISLQKSVQCEVGGNSEVSNILVEKPLVWSFEVTNQGNVPLQEITINDPSVGQVTCPSDTSLPEGQTITCTASGFAQAGDNENTASVTAVYKNQEGVVLETVTSSDVTASYFGLAPSLSLKKTTQGQDANSATGPYIQKDAPVYWGYEVTNNGNVDLQNITVTDSEGETVVCQAGNTIAQLSYDPNNNNSYHCLAVGTAIEGQYSNTGYASVSITDDCGNEEEILTLEDPSHYFGADLSIDIEKATNGVDADAEPGVFVVEGDTVEWSYEVTNTSNVTIDGISATDNTLGITLACDKDSLEPLESTSCTPISESASLGQYMNEACAEASFDVVECDLDGSNCFTNTVKTEDCDLSHYYGFISNQPSIELSVDSPSFTAGEEQDLVEGTFTIDNASDGPEVKALGVENITFIVEYADPNAKGNPWKNALPSDSQCSTDPQTPFVMGDGTSTEFSQEVHYECSIDPSAIPNDFNEIRVTVCVEIFNREQTGKGKNSGETKLFCSSSD